MARKADPNARAALIAAARVEFARSGLAKARIEDITKLCGLSKGSFYLHFESKDSLFAHLVTALNQQIEALIHYRHEEYRLLGRSKESQSVRAQRLLQLDTVEDLKLLEHLWEWRDVLQVLTAGCGGTPFESVMVSMLDAEVARIRTQADSMKKSGLIPKNLDTELMGNMMVGTYFLLIRKLARSSKKPDFKRWVLGLQQLMLHGIYSQSNKDKK